MRMAGTAGARTAGRTEDRRRRHPRRRVRPLDEWERGMGEGARVHFRRGLCVSRPAHTSTRQFFILLHARQTMHDRRRHPAGSPSPGLEPFAMDQEDQVVRSRRGWRGGCGGGEKREGTNDVVCSACAGLCPSPRPSRSRPPPPIPHRWWMHTRQSGWGGRAEAAAPATVPKTRAAGKPPKRAASPPPPPPPAPRPLPPARAVHSHSRRAPLSSHTTTAVHLGHPAPVRPGPVGRPPLPEGPVGRRRQHDLVPGRRPAVVRRAGVGGRRAGRRATRLVRGGRPGRPVRARHRLRSTGKGGQRERSCYGRLCAGNVWACRRRRAQARGGAGAQAKKGGQRKAQAASFPGGARPAGDWQGPTPRSAPSRGIP